MNVNEPDNCICGRTVSGFSGCPVHSKPGEQLEFNFKVPKRDDIRPFVSIEQEAEFRALYRNHYKKFGITGLYLTMGEMAACMKILNEVINEVVDEQIKKRQQKEKE